MTLCFLPPACRQLPAHPPQRVPKAIVQNYKCNCVHAPLRLPPLPCGVKTRGPRAGLTYLLQLLLLPFLSQPPARACLTLRVSAGIATFPSLCSCLVLERLSSPGSPSKHLLIFPDSAEQRPHEVFLTSLTSVRFCCLFPL